MTKPIIVEFNGLPGLGKTTVSKLLIDELNREGYTTIRNYRRNVFHTLHHPFPELYNLKLFRLVSAYAKSIPPVGTRRTHVHWTNFYAQKYESIMKDCNVDFAIIDEGIIQFFQAMAYDDNLPESSLVDSIVMELKLKGIQFIRVDLVNNVEIAARRVLSRPSRGLAYESMKQDELFSTLRTEAANFEYLRSVFSKVYKDQVVITINTLDDPERNANLIKESLIQHLTLKKTCNQ